MNAATSRPLSILALVGSPRKKGNTARLVELIGEQMQALSQRAALPLVFETLYLVDMDIRPCLGCRTCFDRGEDHCPLKDDIPAIKAKMDAADAVLLASPVYMDDVSGLVKNWIDRLAYVSHRPAFGGKAAYPIATVGSSLTSHTLRTMNSALLTWGFHLTGRSGLKMGALTPPGEMARYRPAAAKIAGELFQAVSYVVEALPPPFVSLMAFSIQQRAWQRAKAGSYDFAYWKGQGWLEPGRTFYVSHRGKPPQVALARATGAVVAKIMI